MTIVKAALPSAAAQQELLYNRAGPNIVRETYTPSAGLHWAVVGCVMEDVFDPDTDEVDFVAAVEALSEVTNLVDPIIYGETPASIVDVGKEAVLYVTSGMRMTVGEGGDTRTRTEQEHETAKPPVDKQWLVLNLVVPSALYAVGIAALEAALVGVQVSSQNVISVAEHLIDGTVRSDAVDVALTIEARIRVDKKPA
jgi:hypothetical protein